MARASISRIRLVNVEWYPRELAAVSKVGIAAYAAALGERGTRFGIANSRDRPTIGKGYVEGWYYHYSLSRPPPGFPRAAGLWGTLEVGNADFKWHWIEKGVAPHVSFPNRPNFRISTPADHTIARTLAHLTGV